MIAPAAFTGGVVQTLGILQVLEGAGPTVVLKKLVVKNPTCEVDKGKQPLSIETHWKGPPNLLAHNVAR